MAPWQDDAPPWHDDEFWADVSDDELPDEIEGHEPKVSDADGILPDADLFSDP
jgi:hypothetical protein